MLFLFSFVDADVYGFVEFNPQESKGKRSLLFVFGLLRVVWRACGHTYPNDVFIDLVMINIQTMIHHGGMIVVGCTLMLAQKVSFRFAGLFKASMVFFGLLVIALIMDIVCFKAGLTSFNMFYISPYIPNHLPILSNIYQTRPYIVFLLGYSVGFVFEAFLMQKMGQGLNSLLRLLGSKSYSEKPGLVTGSKV